MLYMLQDYFNLFIFYQHISHKLINSLAAYSLYITLFNISFLPMLAVLTAVATNINLILAGNYDTRHAWEPLDLQHKTT